MRHLFAQHALTPTGWKSDVSVAIDDNGRIGDVTVGEAPNARSVGILLPAPVNLHSHAFQRAMAGMTERRGPDPRDTFWTWRKLMFAFLDHLSPDHVEAITAFVQMEMLEAGYACVGEFHYLHHQPGGVPYDDLGELAQRVVNAARTTGIGLSLLPVLYQHGGCDGRDLSPGQIRFGNDPERFARLHERAAEAVGTLHRDSTIGVAPHSLRAVSQDGLSFAIALAGARPIHMHLAEQIAEVSEIEAAWGKRPTRWLLDNHDVNDAWCLIHCTQMVPAETEALARSGAVAGLCPITESSLGDGIFDGLRYASYHGRFGVGSDSNIRISLSEELRTLEYSQRLRDKGRAVLARADASTGRVLYDSAVAGGAQAAGRESGAIAAGKLADLVALDAAATDLEGRTGDDILDAFIFAGDDRMITDVWSAGRHMVQDGRHVAREAIETAYRKTMRGLREVL